MDAKSNPFDGGKTYKVHMPPNIPAKDFWSLTIYDNQTRSDRFIIGTSANYTPLSWFSNKFRVGLDMNIGRAELYFPPQPAGLDPFSARASFDLVNTKGFIAQGRPLNQDFTINYDATVTRDVSSSLVSNSSFGVQFLSNTYHRTDAYGQDLGSFGIRSVSSAAVTTGGEQDTTQKSIGFYVQQQAAWRDRLFLTGALRVDNNSAFGSQLNRVVSRMSDSEEEMVLGNRSSQENGLVVREAEIRGAQWASEQVRRAT